MISMSSTIAECIDEILACHNWSQADLADVLGWGQQALSEIMQGKRRIDASQSLALATVSDHSPEDWLALQTKADIAEAMRSVKTLAELAEIRKRADLEEIAPVRQLIAQKIIPRTKNAAEREKAVTELLADGYVPGTAAKKTDGQPEFNRIQNAWLAIAARRARQMQVAEFDAGKFAMLAQSLPRMVKNVQDIGQVQAWFAAAGVPLIYVPPLPGGKIDGVSFSLETHPAIAITGRGKRFDKIFYTILHEASHIVNGHWLEAVNLRENEECYGGTTKREQEADQLATFWLYPNGIQPPRPLTKQAITQLAANNDVAKDMVIGHLQHIQALPWRTIFAKEIGMLSEEELKAWA